MAFTGTPTVKSLGRNRVRITGLSLVAAANGTIGLPGDGTAGVQLPATFPVVVDGEASSEGTAMADLVDVEIIPAGANANGLKLFVTKGGAPFQVTITNSDGANATPALEIIVSYAPSIVR